MAITDTILELNGALQDAKDAITTKGGTTGDTGLAGLASEISSIPSGGSELMVAITSDVQANMGGSFTLDTLGGTFMSGYMTFNSLPETSLVGVKASSLLDANGLLHWSFMINDDEVIYDTPAFYQYNTPYNLFTGTIPFSDGGKVGMALPLKLPLTASDWTSLGARSTTGAATLSGTLYQTTLEAYDARILMDTVRCVNTGTSFSGFRVSNLPAGICLGQGGWTWDVQYMNGFAGTFQKDGTISDITGDPYIGGMFDGATTTWQTPTQESAKCAINIADAFVDGQPGGQLSLTLWVADGYTLEDILGLLDATNTNFWWYVTSDFTGDFSITPSSAQIQSWNTAMSHLGTTNTITLKDSPAVPEGSTFSISQLVAKYGVLEPISNFPNWGTIRVGSDPSSWEEVGEPFLCFGRASQTIPTRKLYPM